MLNIHESYVVLFEIRDKPIIGIGHNPATNNISDSYPKSEKEIQLKNDVVVRSLSMVIIIPLSSSSDLR